MPLIKGGKESIGPNITAELASGKPKAQATAIALDVARKSGAKIPYPKSKRRMYRDGMKF